MNFSKIGSIICCFVILSNVLFTTSYNITQIPDIPQFDDRTFFGFEYGSAGISIALLEAYSSSKTDNATKNQILNIATNSMEKLWDDRIEYEEIKYPTWRRSVEEQFLSVYPGIKYGAPGIIQAFLKLFELTEDPKWLNRAEESYWFLSTQAINASTNPHWPYYYNMPYEDSGISITDLKYGSTGILSLGIELYEITQNQNYLDHGELIISWLNKISFELIYDEISYNVIPWYSIDGFTSTELPFYTTNGFGLAGIAPQLYQFGNIALSDKDKDWAIDLGRLLVELQLEDGSWYSVSDSQSVINVGFDNGVAGILDGLFELKLLSTSTEFDDAISRGIDWLFTRFLSNSTHVGFFNYLSGKTEIEITNSLYDGNIGILRTLTKLSSYLTTDQLDLLIHTYKWIITSGSFVITNAEKELLFLLESQENHQFVDFSYAQGLAGLLSELVTIGNNSVISTGINFNLTRAMIAAINTFEYFQQSNGHWQRQYVIPSGWNLGHFTISNVGNGVISSTIIPSELNSNVSSSIDSKPRDGNEYLVYFVPLIMILPIYLITKRMKVSKK